MNLITILSIVAVICLVLLIFTATLLALTFIYKAIKNNLKQ